MGIHTVLSLKLRDFRKNKTKQKNNEYQVKMIFHGISPSCLGEIKRLL
jgi:hypothetical protein